MALGYYHKVRGKREECRLWLPPDTDAYWHMCGDPEEVVALTVPTDGGPVVVEVKSRAHAMKIEQTMKELKARAKLGLLDWTAFDYYRSPKGEHLQTIDLLLRDLGISEAGDMVAFIALRGYALRLVQVPASREPVKASNQTVRVKSHKRRRR